MNPAQKARACQTGAGLAAASGIYPATHHPYYLIPGLISAAILAAVAASYQREAAEDTARTTAQPDHDQEQRP
ncbi:hypothetical protein ABZ690_34325 [Streptomyces sp. NPDC006967]|uniref:hypothetical protein n=1 Tax=Streptomyces sp. NPDC006967 TaxID=3156906 RepID=UPI0033E40082